MHRNNQLPRLHTLDMLILRTWNADTHGGMHRNPDMLTLIEVGIHAWAHLIGSHAPDIDLTQHIRRTHLCALNMLIRTCYALTH